MSVVARLVKASPLILGEVSWKPDRATMSRCAGSEGDEADTIQYEQGREGGDSDDMKLRAAEERKPAQPLAAWAMLHHSGQNPRRLKLRLQRGLLLMLLARVRQACPLKLKPGHAASHYSSGREQEMA